MTAHTSPAPRPGATRKSWLALLVLLAGMFMALLDTTIVNVALPTIRDTLDASEATLSWIISGYALAFGLALIPAGKVGDRAGHKWIFIVGLAGFTIASLACGLSQSEQGLIISRVVQGLAGGIFVPAVAATIQMLFPHHQRARAFALMGMVIGVATALGPILGGLIIQGFGDADGWRYVFWVNVPIGVLVLIAAFLLLPDHGEAREAAGVGVKHPTSGVFALDWTGVLLISVAMVAILVPLIEGQDRGWPLWTFLSLVLGMLLVVIFGWWEMRVTRRGDDPLVPPHLFSYRSYTGGVILAMVYFAAFTGIFFTISLLWQAGLGHSALESGLVTVPFAIAGIVGSSQGNRLAVRYGRRVLVVGTGMLAAGLIALRVILTSVEASDLTHWTLLVPLVVAGLGNGLFIGPNQQFIVATVDNVNAGAANGVVQAMQRIGSAIGIALVGTVLFGSLKLTGSGPTAVADAFVTAASAAMLVSVILAVAAFALVFALPKRMKPRG